MSCRHRPPATSELIAGDCDGEGTDQAPPLCATKGSDRSEITRRLQRPQLGLRTADQGDDLNVGDNVFRVNHNIAPSGR
jgi:hypothetical protein